MVYGEQESLLVAIGITIDGYRKILGVQLGDRESSASWREFFKDLKRRGFKGENLIMGIMDGLPGLESAFTEALPKSQSAGGVMSTSSGISLQNFHAKSRKIVLPTPNASFTPAPMKRPRNAFMPGKMPGKK